MSWSPLPLLCQLVALPLRVGVGALHRLTTGSRALVDIVVAPGEDLAAGALLLARVRRLVDDPLVRAVFLDVRGAPGAWATCEDWRRVILELRTSGRKVTAYLEDPSQRVLLFAAACDAIVVPPLADVELVGLGGEMAFFGETLDRLGLEADVCAAGAYKSFGEPFTRTYPSAENRESSAALLADVESVLVQGLAAGRSLTEEAVRGLMARGPLTADEAVEAGLIDAIGYRETVLKTWKEALGKGTRRVPFRAWAMRDGLRQSLAGWGGGKRVAVLHLDGSIVVDANSGRDMIRSRDVVPALRALTEADEVAAVVLHVRSGGGSAFASDLIWEAVRVLSEKKPVVASFHDVSASGGFYLAAPVREIFVRSTTLTGSIGVFGGKLVLRDALRRIGVTMVPMATQPGALRMSPTRPFNDDERERFRASLQHVYDGFVERVATGRGRTVEEIEPHCRGRIWSGPAALRVGLVDRVGDLFDAVARAAELADLGSGWRRVDMTTRPESMFMTAVRALLRRQGLGVAAPDPVGAVLTRLLGPARAERVELLANHPGEPLAMLAEELELR